MTHHYDSSPLVLTAYLRPFSFTFVTWVNYDFTLEAGDEMARKLAKWKLAGAANSNSAAISLALAAGRDANQMLQQRKLPPSQPPAPPLAPPPAPPPTQPPAPPPVAQQGVRAAGLDARVFQSRQFKEVYQEMVQLGKQLVRRVCRVARAGPVPVST